MLHVKVGSLKKHSVKRGPPQVKISTMRAPHLTPHKFQYTSLVVLLPIIIVKFSTMTHPNNFGIGCQST